MNKLINWNPMTQINWAPVSVEPPKEEDKPETFPLVISCRTAEEREQISAELTKHGIKCNAVHTSSLSSNT